MRVLLINEVCGTGSTGRICTDLAVRLEKEGHEVKIAYGRDGNVPEQYKRFGVRIGKRTDILCHGIMARVFDMAGFGSRQATIRFLKWVKRYNPDVIHLHNLHGYYINVEVLFKYLKGCQKRIVWTLHDCWAYTGHSAYCDVVRCERWKEGCYQCPQTKIYPKSYTDRSKNNWEKKRGIFTNVPNTTLVCPSEWLAGQIKESYLEEYSVKVIHNSIDMNVFRQRQNDFRDVWKLENYFLILGVLKDKQDRKGEEEFIKLSQLIDNDAKIVLVGGNKYLENISSNIICISPTSSPKEMACIYAACNVLYIPMHSDLDGNVRAAATACNLPIVSCGNADECPDSFAESETNGKCGEVPRAIWQINELKQQIFSVGGEALQRKDEGTKSCVKGSEYSRDGLYKSKIKYNLLGKKVLISVATVWSDMKGQKDLFDISRRLPDDCILIMVGKMNKKNVENLPSNTIYIPKTQDKSELAEYYGMADLYINCTYCDTYPTVNLEAAACGTPIATYDVGGSTEIARKTYGRWCDRGDVEGMLEMIKSINLKDCFRSGISEKNQVTGSIDEYIQIYGVHSKEMV